MKSKAHTWLRLILSGKFNRQTTAQADELGSRSNARPVAFEDQVVAAVFAELGWIADGRAVLPFLQTNVRLNDMPWIRSVRSVCVELWPWWSLPLTSEGAFSVEPDAVLRFDLGADLEPRLMTVEAKLAGSLEPGQLSRQQVAGARQALAERRKFEGVVYVTDDHELPRISEPPRPGFELDASAVFWCSWRSLRTVLPEVRALSGECSRREVAVLEDLAACLSYWDLEPFHEVAVPNTKALSEWAAGIAPREA